MTHPTFPEFARSLGIDLLPWQLEHAERLLAGDRTYFYSGRRSGLRTIRKTIDEYQKMTGGGA